MYSVPAVKRAKDGDGRPFAARGLHDCSYPDRLVRHVGVLTRILKLNSLLVIWSKSNVSVIMPKVGAYEAKTHLSKLLERVEQGERFIITKRGRPVAELIPIERPDAETVRRAIHDLRAFREELRTRGFLLNDVLREGETLRELAHQGHRC